MFGDADGVNPPEGVLGKENVSSCLAALASESSSSVLRLLSMLAPDLTFEPASFDAVLNMLHRQWVLNRLSCSRQESSFTKTCMGFERPASADDHKPLLQNTEGASGHPNIVPVLGACKGDDMLCLFYPAAPFSLESILHFSPKVLEDDWDIRFLVYQLVSAIGFCHDHGIVHGDLKPSNILLTEMLWCWITGFHVDFVDNITKKDSLDFPRIYVNSGVCKHLIAEPFEAEAASNNLQSAFRLWWKGELSNYDYLLLMNKLAGRRWGDYKFHTVMPWVIDFSVRPDNTSENGWRDLTKSKWRLAKGDEQLDFMYSTAEIPHHVSDECLSELAVCIYKARRLPLCILRRTVRSVYEPNEYPVSLQRLYQWTPDECIPEFYSDASVFTSVHPGMCDLAVPAWAKSAEDFILCHREALEGEHVSNNLHQWIDLTFGYKLSGEAAIAAKNVTLSASNTMLPRSQGRRQLFSVPHPRRQHATLCSAYKIKDGEQRGRVLKGKGWQSQLSREPQSTFASLEALEEATLFCESVRSLFPVYISNKLSKAGASSVSEEYSSTLPNELPKQIQHTMVKSGEKSLSEVLEAMEVKSSSERSYQDFLLWQSTALQNCSPVKGAGCDIFALGCMVAELYLGKPFFDLVSHQYFEEHGVEPSTMQQLPVHVQEIVRIMTKCGPKRSLSAASLLQSPFFPQTVRAVHTFVSMLYLIETCHDKLEFVAKLASQGAFARMGSLAAKRCASFCVSPLVLPSENVPVHTCITFLNAALIALKPQDATSLLLPAIQKLLQGQGNNQLKIALLQPAFVRAILKSVGVASYLQVVHPVVLSVLHQYEHLEFGNAASGLLIETCEELGVPITSFQTIRPLIQQFGRDIANAAIDTIIGIGKRLGDCLILKHLVPSLRSMIVTCLSAISKEKTGPAKSWRMLVMRDAVVVLERLLETLSSKTVYLELVQEPHNVLESILFHPFGKGKLKQHAAKALLSVCQCIGPDPTTAYVLPRLRPLFSVDEVTVSKGDPKSSINISLPDDVDDDTLSLNTKFKSQMSVIHILYSGLASLLGIEKVRQCFSTWPIVEQLLDKIYRWKWDSGIGGPRNMSSGQWESGIGGPRNMSRKLRESSKPTAKVKPELSPTSLLINEIGWSVPQPLPNRGKPSKGGEAAKELKGGNGSAQHGCHGSWMWLPVSEDVWEGTEYLNRPAGLVFNAGKDERPWKVKASVFHSWRGHPGPIKAVACNDGETMVFTAGVGMKMRGLVKVWQLATTELVMDYSGHEEAVNDICVLPWTERVVSCDGTIHLWDIRTGDLLAVFSESNNGSLPSSTLKDSGGPNVGTAMTAGTALSNGMLFTGIHGSHYTCMHLMEMEQKLMAGTGNGHMRFFDLESMQSLHLWQCEPELSGSSLVSAIATSAKIGDGDTLPSWIAAGFGLGQCRLLDLRVGNFVASWRAHEGYITKLHKFQGHYLVSSSLDKTLCLWDLRRNVPAHVQVFHGHSHGVSSFGVWNNELFSVGGNKIGISTLSQSSVEAPEWQTVRCHKLFSSDLSNLNLSSITAISVLPFSRFFIVGSDDGYLRICR